MNGQTVRLVGPEQRRLAHELVEQAADNSIVNVRPETRSNLQNAKMWAMLSDVSRAKPDGREYSPEIWKSLFMAEAGFTPIWEPSLDGQGVVPIGFKSSQLTKAEFADVIEAIYAYGSEHGVKWSEPVPEQWASQMRQDGPPGADATSGGREAENAPDGLPAQPWDGF